MTYFRLVIMLVLAMLVCGCQGAPIAVIAPNTVESVIRDTRPEIFAIHVGDALCSGFHIGGGLIITAAHCLGAEPTKYKDKIFVEDLNGSSSMAELVIMNVHKDLIVLEDNQVKGLGLSLWSDLDGRLTIGRQIISFGFPGYYDSNYTFETGYIKDLTMIDGRPTITARSMSFPGESGGPVIDIITGKVIGVNSRMSEVIYNFKKVHQHNTMSYFIPSQEIILLLADFALKGSH